MEAAMANQPSRQQPLEPPYRANPTPPPRPSVPTPWPAAHASPTPPPPPETQPQPPSPTQSKPPSPSRSPSATLTVIPIRRAQAQSPSSSPLLSPSSSPSQRSSQKQPAEQTPLQQPSPSTRRSLEPSPTPTRSRSTSPPQEASEPQQEVATQEVPQAPSLSSPSVLQPDSPTKKPPEPQPQESQPTVEALSQTTVQPQPEPSTRPQAQEQRPSKPAPQTTEAGNQPTEDLEPKTVSVDTVLSTTPSQNHISERELKEIKEERSTTNRELKQEQPLVEERQQIGIESEEDREPSKLPPMEEKPQKDEELKQNIQTSHQPQVEGKPEKNMEPRSPTSETLSQGNKNDDPKTKPEVQLAKKSTLSSDEPKNTTEIMSSIAEPDSQTPRLHPATSELITKPRSSGQQANLNGSNGREKTIGPRPRSIPLASPSRGERASFHKEIKEGISKLIQNLNLGQLQQPGGGSPIRITTLAGENKGATMFVGHETAKVNGVLHINRGHRLNNNKAEASSGNKEIQKQLLSHTGNKNPPITASINSNVQGINNSLLQESSCSEEDPGVHLVLSIKPGKPVKLK